MSRRPRPGPSPWPSCTTPSRSDRFVRGLSQRLGGPLGRHADTGRRWWNPAAGRPARRHRWSTWSGCCSGCRAGSPSPARAPDHFRYLCYSDIGILYGPRGLLQGNAPYLDSGNYQVLEYPVLTGWFLELARLITVGLWARRPAAGLTDQQQVDSTLIFVDVNTVLLGALLLVAVWAQVRSVPHRPWDAMMLAASPCVAAAALINWDLLAGRADRAGRAVLVPDAARSGRGAAGVWGWRPSSIRCSCSARCCCSVCARAGCGRSVGCCRRS